ncbi:hypothetical protein Taro_015921 [Colocasia esculenta]|uniref:Uncharacterized protein n=1 Tax=Colocasia esculenta TaxID=4460 RepID=A0A843UCK6_COLES|nr:hypothetical protein [Colocasia esculenta]
MRREGRQHGWVRTRMILNPAQDPKPKRRCVNVLDAPPAAGVFAKAPVKPTNHSKFTGRCSKPVCGECRHCPACKSSGKAKGAAKLRRLDATPSCFLGRHGASATEVVGQLTGEDEEREEEEGEEEAAAGLVIEGLEATGEEVHQEFENDDEATDGDRLMVKYLNMLSGPVQVRYN